MKKRILLVVAYDGTGYAGYQAQKSGVPTIEGELNRVLTELTGDPVEVIGASRTDAGVHAYCNLAVFDTESRIPPEKFANAINVRLPEQICVPVSMEVPEDFHPRRCSTVKTYEYRIYNAQMPDPMRRLYTYFSRYRFDVNAMREAARSLVGEHDFKSFCSTYSSAKTTLREVLSVEVEEIPCEVSYKKYEIPVREKAPEGGPDIPGISSVETMAAGIKSAEKAPEGGYDIPGISAVETMAAGAKSAEKAPEGDSDIPGISAGETMAAGTKSAEKAPQESAGSAVTPVNKKNADVTVRDEMPREIVIRVSGKGFLYNMVRIIAGTLMEVGRGFKKPEDIPSILEACDRRAAGATAPACGLTLVRYEVTEPGREMAFGMQK